MGPKAGKVDAAVQQQRIAYEVSNNIYIIWVYRCSMINWMAAQSRSVFWFLDQWDYHPFRGYVIFLKSDFLSDAGMELTCSCAQMKAENM